MSQLNLRAGAWAHARFNRVVQVPAALTGGAGPNEVVLTNPTAADLTAGASPSQVFVPWVNLLLTYAIDPADTAVVGVRVGGAAANGYPYEAVVSEPVPQGAPGVIYRGTIRVERIPVSIVSSVPQLPEVAAGLLVGTLTQNPTNLTYVWEVPDLNWS